MASCKELQSFTTEVLSCVEEILDKIKKLLTLLSESKKIFSPTVSSILSKTKCLRQLVRQTILLLQDDLLKACESLGNYGTNKEMYREIRGEIARKKTQQLKQFLDVCTRRLNSIKDSYDGLCSVTKKLCEEIYKAKQECEELLEGKKWRGVGEVAAGLTAVGGAAALALSSIAAPPLALAVLGAGGFSVFAGIYHIGFKLDDERKKIVEGAHAELEQLNSILHDIHECANRCASTIKRSAKDLKSKNVVGLSAQRGKTQNVVEGSLIFVNIPKCFGFDDNQLKKLVTDQSKTDLNVTLDEFETHMITLLAKTTDARAKTEACIKKFQEPD